MKNNELKELEQLRERDNETKSLIIKLFIDAVISNAGKKLTVNASDYNKLAEHIND